MPPDDVTDIATAQIFDHAARLRSFEIAAGVFETLPYSRSLGAQMLV
jgi:hypothetical protein